MDLPCPVSGGGRNLNQCAGLSSFFIGPTVPYGSTSQQLLPKQIAGAQFLWLLSCPEPAGGGFSAKIAHEDEDLRSHSTG